MTTPFDPAWQLKALIARHGYANSVTRELSSLLQTAFRDVNAKLLDLDPRSPRSPEFQQFSTFLGERLAELNATSRTAARDRIAAAGTAEAEGVRGQANLVLGALGLPSRNQLVAAARYTAIVDGIEVGGVGFGEWWTDTLRGALRKTKVAVQQGIITGTNSLEIARQIYSKREGQRTIASVTLNQWRTGVRTAMTAVQTAATMDELRDMRQVAPRAFSRVRLEAVLDASTSDICRALDGEEYDLDDPNLPQPPLHPWCRSALVPVIDAKALGVKSTTGKRPTNYEQWLRGQPANVQDAVLGTGKAALWRSGAVPLKRMIAEDRTPLSLAQLRTRLGASVATVPVPVPPVAPPAAKDVPIVAPTPQPAKKAAPRPTAAKQAAAIAEAAAPTVNGTGYTASDLTLARMRLSDLRVPEGDDREMLLLDNDTDEEAAKYAMIPFRGVGAHVEFIAEEDGTPAQNAALVDILRNPKHDATALPRERVKMTTVWHTQPTVERSRVEYFIANPDKVGGTSDNGSTSDLPVAVRFKGRNYLVDGHHRAVAHKLLGDAELEVRVFDLDAVKEPAPVVAKPATPSATGYVAAKFQREHSHEVFENPTLQSMVEDYTRAVEDVDAKLAKHRRTVRGQGLLYDAAHAQGFTGKPTVVDEADFERMLPGLKFESFRGVSPGTNGESLAQQFLDGEYYAGYGVYGDGTYAAIVEEMRRTREPGWNAEKVANGYGLELDGTDSKQPTVMRMALRPEARIIKFEDLLPMAQGYQHAMNTEEREAKDAVFKQNLPTDQHYAAIARVQREYDAKRKVLMDSGTLATMLGYDAVHVEHANYVVVLNRTATVVSRTLRFAKRPKW